MVKAIVVRQTGEPEVLHYEDIPVGARAPVKFVCAKPSSA